MGQQSATIIISVLLIVIQSGCALARLHHPDGKVREQVNRPPNQRNLAGPRFFSAPLRSDDGDAHAVTPDELEGILKHLEGDYAGLPQDTPEATATGLPEDNVEKVNVANDSISDATITWSNIALDIANSQSGLPQSANIPSVAVATPERRSAANFRATLRRRSTPVPRQ